MLTTLKLGPWIQREIQLCLLIGGMTHRSAGNCMWGSMEEAWKFSWIWKATPFLGISSRCWKVAQSCPILCNLMDYTVHGILQARIPEWVAIPFSRASSQPWDQTQVSHIIGGFFTSWGCVWSLGWKDPLEKGTATDSSILAWSQRVGQDWVTFIVYTTGKRKSSTI